jgi:hypothetical protein
LINEGILSQLVLLGLLNIDNGACDIEKLLLKIEVNILYSEVNLLIYYSARSKWTKCQQIKELYSSK